MTRAKKRASASNSPKVAAALAGLEDGTYANAYQAYKATGAPVQTHHEDRKLDISHYKPLFTRISHH
jgi:hypothetical protein